MNQAPKEDLDVKRPAVGSSNRRDFPPIEDPGVKLPATGSPERVDQVPTENLDVKRPAVDSPNRVASPLIEDPTVKLPAVGSKNPPLSPTPKGLQSRKRVPEGAPSALGSDKPGKPPWTDILFQRVADVARRAVITKYRVLYSKQSLWRYAEIPAHYREELNSILAENLASLRSSEKSGAK